MVLVIWWFAFNFALYCCVVSWLQVVLLLCLNCLGLFGCLFSLLPVIGLLLVFFCGCFVLEFGFYIVYLFGDLNSTLFGFVIVWMIALLLSCSVIP